MNLYEILAKNQASTPFSRSQEQIYYNDNSYRLNGLESFQYLANPVDSFGVVRENIVLRSLENKEIIEKAFKQFTKKEERSNDELEKYMGNCLLSLPYLNYKDKKIYVPVFPFAVSSIYSENFSRLGEMPYKNVFKLYESILIDPFDYYGYNIFISYFTNLVLIKKTPECAALYDYDARSIYFVNDEGRLDAKICLFDKYLSHQTLTHLTKRIETVVDAYFANDRELMIQELLENELISKILADKVKKYMVKKENKSVLKGRFI